MRAAPAPPPQPSIHYHPLTNPYYMLHPHADGTLTAMFPTYQNPAYNQYGTLSGGPIFRGITGC